MTPTTLAGLTVIISKLISKTAVRVEGKLYVSPAMWSLLESEKGEDLRRLLEAIPILSLAEFPSVVPVLPPAAHNSA